jgi:hypothetical protein
LKLIAFFCKQRSMRLDYVVTQVFEQWLGVSVRFFRDAPAYLNSDLPRINYSRERLCPEEVFIPCSGFLEETGIRVFHPEVGRKSDLPTYLFPMAIEGADFPFDLLAMCFYLLSRYEEYKGSKRDRHDRFSAAESLAFREDFLKQPLVDQWVKQLYEKLSSKDPALELRGPTYRFRPTYDIDYAWAFLHKSPFRALLGIAKDLVRIDYKTLLHRLQVFSGQSPDPFNTFSELEDLHKKYRLSPHYFFLLADYGKYDKNISWKSKAMHRLVQGLAKEGAIGLHPSYYSTPSGEVLPKEKLRLEVMSRAKVFRSRQHFLRLHLPSTYRNLLENGITEDYTMGYPDQPGFRASTSRPFLWYDLEKEQTTKLMIHPFQVMDGALKNYLKLSPEEALEAVRPLIRATREVGGDFTSLWHNSSFSEIGGWEEWKGFYKSLVSEAADTSDL